MTFRALQPTAWSTRGWEIEMVMMFALWHFHGYFTLANQMFDIHTGRQCVGVRVIYFRAFSGMRTFFVVVWMAIMVMIIICSARAH